MTNGPGKLAIKRNHLYYVATFAQPAFGLWDKGSALEGLHSTLRPFGISLADISSVQSQTSVLEEGIVVKLGERATLTLKLDRLEVNLRNYQTRDLGTLPDYLKGVEYWLRASVPNHRFAARVIQSLSHAEIGGVSTEEVLRSLGVRDLAFKGVSRGHGVNYHFAIPESQTHVDLLLDHSVLVSGALFVQLTLLMEADQIDYAGTFVWARRLIDEMLAQVGLAFSEDS